MSLTSPVAQPYVPMTRPVSFLERIKPYLAPYYLTVAAVLGAATVGFVVVIGLLILVTANCNLLGWVE